MGIMWTNKNGIIKYCAKQRFNRSSDSLV